MSNSFKKNFAIASPFLVVLFVFLLNKYCSKQDEKINPNVEVKIEKDVNEGVNDNSEIFENDGTINKTDVGNNSGTINTGDQTINNYQIKNESVKGYKIKGSSELLKQLKNSNKILINQNSQNNIELSYSGGLLEISNNSKIYIYNGGYLRLLINNEPCKNFKNLKLDYIKANPKNKIESELRSRIDEHVKNNFVLIQKSIFECI